MDVSKHGVEFTAKWENIYQDRYCPFYDAYGRVWTRAYGETDWSGNFGGKCISHAEALYNLERDLNNPYGDALNKFLQEYKIQLNQNQFDSGVDILYNLGVEALEWNIFQSIKNHQYLQAANEMLEYRFAGGVELAGLAERRKGDRELFLTPSRPIPPPNPLSVLYPPERSALEDWINHKQDFDKLVLFRKNIYEAAVHGRLYTNKKQRIQRGWGINYRYQRYQLLKHYTKD